MIPCMDKVLDRMLINLTVYSAGNCKFAEIFFQFCVNCTNYAFHAFILAGFVLSCFMKIM